VPSERIVRDLVVAMVFVSMRREGELLTFIRGDCSGPLTAPSTSCGFDARIVGNSGRRFLHQR